MLISTTEQNNLLQQYQVYDVTPFMEEHPGGDEVLLSATGLFISSEGY